MNKEYIQNEFYKLKSMIDNDKEHFNKLNKKMDSSLCRYADIRPYEHNTVKLKNGNPVNASWIDLPYPHAFIATQGPMNSTIDDFFDMCIENDVELIVMLCREIEKNSEKCAKYWEVKKSKHDGCDISLIKEEKSVSNFIERTIEVRYNGKIKEITQIQYLGWPDHGVPEMEESYDNFIKMFTSIEDFEKKYDKNQKNNKPIPVLVHCSAGIGRTGVFVTLYSLYKEINAQISSCKKEIHFNVFNLLRKIKEMRMYSVENFSQYEYIYKFIENLLDKKNN